MTGFGRFETRNGDHTCKAEARSVNNRYIEINTRLPKYLSPLEIPLKKLVKDKCARGSFDITVTMEKNDGANGEQEVKPNLALASQYLKALNQIKESLGLAGGIDINTVLAFKDLIKFEAPAEPDPSKREVVLETVGEALTALIKMREEEGENLQKDILGHLAAIEKLADSINERQPAILEEYKNKLRERIKTLAEGIAVDEARLTQETAIMADRCDVSEEIVRLKSHLQQFNILIAKEDLLGRKLEFITQEINREVNTIGSKTIDYEVSRMVIEAKSLLEKIREQLQNIE